MNDMMLFKVFCIEQYKKQHHLCGRETVQLFFQYGVLEYLQSFYDVLHTAGAAYLIEEIDLYLKSRQYGKPVPENR